MYTITTNSKGSRSIEVSEQHLDTIYRYKLLNNLTDSVGIVTEENVEKLRMHLRSLLEHVNNDPALIDLCQNVIFHNNMKAIGLQNLIALYKAHAPSNEDSEGETTLE